MWNFFNKKQPEPIKRSKRYVNKPIMLGNEIATRQKVDFNMLLGYLPDPDEILEKNGKLFDVYRSIMIDSQVRSCANNRKAGTKSLDWSIDKGTTNKSKESQFIEEYYRNDFDIDSVNDMILNAPLYGFQPIEIIWGKVGGYIVPVELIPKNQEWFMFDDQGRLRLSTWQGGIIGELLPERKFLTPRYNDITNSYYNPYGDRILSSCFWPATFKKSGFKWWVTFTEKYGMPFLLGKIAAGQEANRDDMIEQLQAMVQDAVGVITGDSEVEITSTGDKGSSAYLYSGLIQECDSAITKVIMGQTLTTEASAKGGVGTYALGKVHAEVRDDVILSDKRIVENTHNQLIKWITEINFGTLQRIPRFNMFEHDDVKKAIADRDKVVKDTGFKFTKKYVMDTYGYNEDDIDEYEPPVNTPFGNTSINNTLKSGGNTLPKK